MTYAEIAAGRPRYGGEYAFLRDAFGDLTGFLYMWTWIAIAKPASLATIVAGLARVLGSFALIGFFAQPAFAGMLWSQVFAIAVVWLITALNIVSTRESANVQLVLTWLKGLLILVIAGFCFGAGVLHPAAAHGAWQNITTSFSGARGGFGGFMIALIAALWAYDGWTDVSQMAGEVQNPQRSLPFALIGGLAIVGVLYMLTNAAIQYVLPAATIAASDRPTVDAMRIVAGHWGAALVTLGMAVSMAATFVGSSLSGARVTFAASRDGLFFSRLAHVNRRFHTPDASLLVQAILTSLMLLFIGRFQALFSLAIFADWVFYGLTTSTVFVFRRRDAAIPGPHAALQHVGIPGAARDLHPGRRRARRLFLLRSAAQLARRRRDHPAGHPAASVAAAKTADSRTPDRQGELA